MIKIKRSYFSQIKMNPLYVNSQNLYMTPPKQLINKDSNKTLLIHHFQFYLSVFRKQAHLIDFCPCNDTLNYYYHIIFKEGTARGRFVLELDQIVVCINFQCHVQGWIGYVGSHVPMFVHKLGLIKLRQT